MSEFKLTPVEARDLWVKALRGGEYRQTTSGRLKGFDGHCCLGVACELFRQTEGRGKWIAPRDPERQEEPHLFVLGRVREPAFLPSEVQKWLGLTSTDGQLKGAKDGARRESWGGMFSIAGVNDVGMDFAFIAGEIEAGWVEVGE